MKWFGPTSPTVSGGWPAPFKAKLMASNVTTGVGIGANGPGSGVRNSGWAQGNGLLCLGRSSSSSSGGWNSFLSSGVMTCGRSLTSPTNSEGTAASPAVISTLEPPDGAWAGSWSETTAPTRKVIASAVRKRNHFRFDRDRYIIFMVCFFSWRDGLGVFIRASPGRFEKGFNKKPTIGLNALFCVLCSVGSGFDSLSPNAT